MKVIIKGRKGIKIPQNLKAYAEEKVLKYELMVEEPAICEVMLADVRGPKGGIDKVVHITMSVPRVKRPIFVSSKTTDFMASIDVAEGKLEQQISKYKGKKKIGSRFPVKYWLNKMLGVGTNSTIWIKKRLKK